MRILYVTTISQTVNAFLIPHIIHLVKQGYKVDVACRDSEKLDSELKKYTSNIYEIKFNRNPMSLNNLIACQQLFKIFQINKYEIVHTHTPVASACVRLIGVLFKKTKIIYTAHGFHFHKKSSKLNWLLFFPMEYILSYTTNLIITINQEDYKIAKKYFFSDVKYMPGVGIDFEKKSQIKLNKEEIRDKFHIPKDAILLLSVGELNKNKNHETIIKALEKIDNDNLYYLICGEGNYRDKLSRMILKSKLKSRIIFSGYQKDVSSIYNSADVFLFPSLREGLGIAALEAMFFKLPLITSNVHGIIDYSINNETGYVCDPKDVEGFADSINLLIKQKELRIKMGCNNQKFVINKYSIEDSLKTISEIYKRV